MFVIGATTAGWLAAGAVPSRPYLTAIAAGWVVEAGLLSVARPGLSVLAFVIAFACAALLAMLGAWIGLRLEKR